MPTVYIVYYKMIYTSTIHFKDCFELSLVGVINSLIRGEIFTDPFILL